MTNYLQQTPIVALLTLLFSGLGANGQKSGARNGAEKRDRNRALGYSSHVRLTPPCVRTRYDGAERAVKKVAGNR